jgi:cytochrome c biogenesis protein CcmG/thiol:disulfide interchange protein DsbE
MKWKLALALAVPCAALIFVLARGFGRDPHAVPFMLRGKPAPSFALKRIDNGEVVSLDRLKGQPVVINFWATWCAPCRMEHPVLEWGYREYGKRVQFLGTVFEDTEENVRAQMRETGSPYPQLLDPLSRTAVDYGVAGVPETYFIDAQGIIRDKHVGPLDPRTLASQIKALLLPNAEAAQ